ncbi:MAG: TlpA family protein disulfide reductase [Candidatus Eremiobacteraeota bacterium]|nr:TlpA family protein disulfide reductase [Candidatus Eremiobacteraeota bacterium]
MHWIRAVSAACVALACLVLPLAGFARKHSGSPSTGLNNIYYGVRPPDFLYDVGKGATLLSWHYGKPIVINFWATWCQPCRDELPAFQNLVRNDNGGATLITLSAEAPGVARAFLREHNIALPVSEDSQRRVFDEYSIGPLPVTIILDPNGTVSHVAVGELDWKELHAAVQAALALEAAASQTPPGGVQP